MSEEIQSICQIYPFKNCSNKEIIDWLEDQCKWVEKDFTKLRLAILEDDDATIRRLVEDAIEDPTLSQSEIKSVGLAIYVASLKFNKGNPTYDLAQEYNEAGIKFPKDSDDEIDSAAEEISDDYLIQHGGTDGTLSGGK